MHNIVVTTCVLHNFIRIHDREDEGFKWEESNAGETHRNAQESMENIQDEGMKIIRDNIARSICGLEKIFLLFLLWNIFLCIGWNFFGLTY
jgi:hypothetical protein